MDEKARKLVEKIERERGFAGPWRKILAEYDPEFLELFHKQMMHMNEDKQGLPRKMKEIIKMTLSSFTNYEPGFRVHLRNALKEGATPMEIIEALENGVHIGIHSLATMLPAMADELQKFQQSNNPAGKPRKEGAAPGQRKRKPVR
ncbi:MAG: carboxymuconolactone decarboxylase family protein [Chloroflexi bacterium]|nr:carboxymuconolactone decarboxylase family protein [Chloroflexota bacterium]